MIQMQSPYEEEKFAQRAMPMQQQWPSNQIQIREFRPKRQTTDSHPKKDAKTEQYWIQRNTFQIK